MAVAVTKEDCTVVEYEDGTGFGIDDSSHGHLWVHGTGGRSLAIYAPGRWSHAEVKSS